LSKSLVEFDAEMAGAFSGFHLGGWTESSALRCRASLESITTDLQIVTNISELGIADFRVGYPVVKGHGIMPQSQTERARPMCIGYF